MHLWRETRAVLGAAVTAVATVVVVSAPVGTPPAAAAERCTIVGTDAPDTLRGTAGDDVICGLDGDDKIVGRGGDDLIRGGAGDDVLRGGGGDDVVAGGRGDDRILGQGGDDVVRGDKGDDVIIGGRGNDRMGGFAGADTLLGLGDPTFVDDLRCGPNTDTAEADPQDRVRRDCEQVDQNDPPTDITLTPSSVAENQPVGTTIGALAAVDPDAGDSATFALVAGPGSADNARVQVDGGVLKTAATYDAETDTELRVRLRTTDAVGESVERALVIAVVDVNDPPVAVDDARSGTEDTALEIPRSGAGSPADNDTDQDGDPLAASAVGAATGGTVTLLPDAIRFEPDENLCGTGAASFDYTVSDGDGGTDSGTVTVDLTCVDDDPTAVDDDRTVAEDSGATVFSGLTTNDVDPEGDAVSITGVTDSANGTTSFTSTTVTYTPDADYCNDPPPFDAFTYTVNGGDTATVRVSVTCVDDAPVATDDDRTTAEDTDLVVTGASLASNDADADGDALTVTSVSNPTGGTVGLAAGSVTFTPTADLCSPSPAGFDYTVSDGAGPTDTGRVTVTVTCVNDPPVAVDDNRTGTEDTQAEYPAFGPTGFISGNDSDVDGDSLVFASIVDSFGGVFSIEPGDTVEFTPTANLCGDDAAGFTYVASDGQAGTEATVTIDITCADDAPVAVDDAFTVAEDATDASLDVLANDTDVDGGPISIVSITAVGTANGVPSFGPSNQSITYTPNPDYCNTPPGTELDTYTYQLASGDVGQFTVAVTCADDEPTAVDDAATVLLDAGATAVDVLANDTDGDGGQKAIASATQPANGTVVLTGGAPGEHTGLTYEPDPGYCNTDASDPDDTFTYTLTPGGSSATVSVTVTCDVPPVAVDDAATVAEDASATVVDVLANDTNPDGGPATVTSVDTTGTQGVVTNNGDNVSYTPSADYCNAPPGTTPDTFTYTVNGGSTATVSVTVSCSDDPPVAVDDAATVLEDAGASAVTVLANDTDVDGGPLTIASASDPTNGTVVLTGGSPGAHTGLTYQPDANYCNAPPGTSPDTFTYTVNGGSTATVSVTVTCVNDAPVADDETFSGTNGAIGGTSLLVDDPTDGPMTVTGPRRAVGGDVLDGDTDVDGDTVAVQAGTLSSNDGGTVTIQADGDFVYLPDDDVGCGDGSDFFNYTVTDGVSPTPGEDTGTVFVTITDCVWYVDGSAAPGGDGRSNAPAPTLAPVNGAAGGGDLDDGGDYLFVYGGTFSGGLDLEAGQRLFGQPHGLTVGGTDLVPAGGTNPNIYNAAPVSTGIALANDVEVRRVDAGVAGASGHIAIRASSVTNAIVGGNTSARGEFGVLVDGGASSGDITVGSDITSTAEAAVAVVARTGGTVTFSGSVTATGAGARITSTANTGATVRFTGPISVSGTTQTVRAFDATGGGTVVASHAGNQLTGIGVNALRLDGVTVGVDGVTFATVSTAAGAQNGIEINNVTGTGAVSVAGGTLTTSTRGLDINGGTGDVTIGATLNPTNGRSVEVTGHTSGTVDLNGPVNEDATGINLTTNTGSTVRFDGGVTASTGASPAFTATGGGTVVVTGATNTLATTSGTPLNVANTTIGTDGLTFRSISSNGAPSGIVLNTTGNTAGLTVTGNGGASPCSPAAEASCTGGVIRNSTGDGVSLTSTRSPSLTRMLVTDNGGTGSHEGIEMDNVTGAVTIGGSYVVGAPHNSVDLDNNNTNLAGFTMTGTTLKDPQAATGANGLLVVLRGTSTLTSGSVTGSTFDNAFSAGLQVQTNDTATVSSFNVGAPGAGQGNTFLNSNVGVDMNVSQASDLTFGVRNNTFNGHDSHAVNGFAATASTPGASLTGVIAGNTIGTTGNLDSGSAFGSGIRVLVKGGTAGALSVENNVVREVANNRGIDLGGIRTASGNGGARFRVTGNTVTAPSGTTQDFCGTNTPCPLAAIWVSADNETNSGTYDTCSVITGNSAYDPSSFASGGEAAYYLQANTFTGPSTHRTEGSNANPVTQVAGTNTVTSPGPGPDVVADSPPQVSVVASATCGAFPS